MKEKKRIQRRNLKCFLVLEAAKKNETLNKKSKKNQLIND